MNRITLEGLEADMPFSTVELSRKMETATQIVLFDRNWIILSVNWYPRYKLYVGPYLIVTLQEVIALPGSLEGLRAQVAIAVDEYRTIGLHAEYKVRS